MKLTADTMSITFSLSESWGLLHIYHRFPARSFPLSSMPFQIKLRTFLCWNLLRWKYERLWWCTITSNGSHKQNNMTNGVAWMIRRRMSTCPKPCLHSCALAITVETGCRYGIGAGLSFVFCLCFLPRNWVVFYLKSRFWILSFLTQ